MNEVVASVLGKAGYGIVYPQGLDNLCCGTPFKSKGAQDAADKKVSELEAALLMADAGVSATEHLLRDLKQREVHLADGSRKLVRYAGPIKVEMMGRDCVTAAVVMGDQVLLGAIPMQAMDSLLGVKRPPRKQGWAKPKPRNPGGRR